MKNKFIIFTLCFTIIFTSINFSNYKSYAYNYEPLFVDGGVITAPMVATIGTLAVASGIILSSNDDLYDIAYIFYQKYKDNWEDVKLVFDTCVSIGTDKVVTVGNEFLTLVKDCFDSFTQYLDKGNINLELNGGFWNLGKLQYNQEYYKRAYDLGIKKIVDGTDFSINNLDFKYLRLTPNNDKYLYQIFCGGLSVGSITFNFNALYSFATCLYNKEILLTYSTIYENGTYHTNTSGDISKYIDCTIDIPYVPGSYSPGGVLDEENLGIYVPGNASDLVGSLPSDVVLGGNPSYEYGGDVTLPGVSNPSIDSPISGTFNPSLDSDIPGVDSPSIPNDSIWSTIKDFIISLVVPSDSFWTDTFNEFRTNLNKNFPMLDMSDFDSLLVNGKPFPNIYAFGSIVVNGDIINSIVDWLRPIIAGFVMLLLLFFNYRKLHKIIRNSDPYGSVAEKGCTSNAN